MILLQTITFFRLVFFQNEKFYTLLRGNKAGTCGQIAYAFTTNQPMRIEIKFDLQPNRVLEIHLNALGVLTG